MSRVLLVHADAAIGRELASVLDDSGLRTRVVTSGERAMDRFIQEPADVVVIDYDLEGRDGIATAEAIRWMPGGRRARVILTAARDPAEGKLATLAESVDAFATIVGAPDAERLELEVQRAAQSRPHDADTRVLGSEVAQLHADRSMSVVVPPSGSRSAASGARRWDDHTAPEGEPLAPPTVSMPLTLPQSEEVQNAFEHDDATLDEPVRAEWELRDPDGRAEGREVRAIAEAAQHAHSDAIGSFEGISFARVLHRLADRRATGALICVHPPDERATTEGTEPTKVVYFRAGVPVHVRSNLLDECLGQVLARQRKIGPATLKESLSAMRRGEGRQGELLVRMGAIAPLELSIALADQLREKLFELFGWRRGTFRFAADRHPPTELIDLELGLAEIAHQGIRAGVGPHRALDLLEIHRDRYVVPQPRAMVRFVRMHASEELAALIRRIDGRRLLAELLAGAPDEGEAAMLLHAMECLDAVRFEPRPLRGAAPSGAYASEPDPSEPDPSEPDPSEPDPSEPEVALAGEPDADARTTLPSVPEGAVLAASSAQWEAGDDEATPVEVPPSHGHVEIEAEPVAREAEPVEEHVEPSGERRGEDSLESAEIVDEGLGEHARLDAEPARPAGIDATIDDADDGFATLPEPDSHGAAPLAPVPTRLERPGAKEPAPPRAPLVPRLRPEPSEPPRPPTQEELDARVKRLLRAERHARRGQRALDRERFDEAVEAFAKAAELCPDEGPFFAQLGWAQHLAAPDDAAQLERTIDLAERGCANAPESALAQVMRARLLRAAGREVEAAAAYRRALFLNPEDPDALREAKPR